MSRALLLLGSLLFSLGITELTLRLVEGRAESRPLHGLHEARPEQPWLYGLRAGATRRVPGPREITYAINDQGFRDRSYPESKPPGGQRILVLGDSVTFGFGVELEEVYTEQLERSLATREPPTEVLNFGVGGYNPYNEVALFADRGARYQPDLVLIQFCINDLNAPTLHFDASTQLALGRVPDGAFPDPGLRPADPGRPCAGLRLCARLQELWKRGRGLDAPQLEAAFAPRVGTRYRVEWEWLEARYAELERLAEGIGAQFAIVVFPYHPQLEGEETDLLQRRFRALASRRGWKLVDLLPAFRRASASAETALFLDLWHPSAAGHAVAAQALLDGLQELGLLR